MNKERQEFEKWARDFNFPLYRFSSEHAGYAATTTGAAWQAWQAASQGKQELLRALQNLLQAWDSVCDLRGWDKDHITAAEEARALLKKHGA